MLTGADILVRRLCDHGIECIFGYPGGQLTPMYDALQRTPGIRHILARDEQAAAFMADGYARASGKIGVCLAVCGPGVYNAATPLATAFTDSIPVLLISGQIRSDGLGIRSGYYHENDQLAALASMTKRRSRIVNTASIVYEVDSALAAARNRRPGPVFLEFPLDVQRSEIREFFPPTLILKQAHSQPSLEDIESLAQLLESWQKPLLVAGGGVICAGAESLLGQLADRLGAPVFHSFMGKCALSSEHPLKMGLPWRKATSDLTEMESQHSPLFAEADGALAIGCRFTQAFTGGWTLKMPANLAQIDIDGAEIGRHYPVKLGIQADALPTLRALLEKLPKEKRRPWTAPREAAEPWSLPKFDLVGPLRRALPRDAIVVADITRLSYILLKTFPVYEPRTFLHPAGFVAMGFGIPAALGARAAFPDRKIVAVVGDGCFLMSGMELASAVQEKLPIVVVLVNDGCLTLIKAIQERRYQNRFLGVDLQNPDFGLFAQAFGVPYWKVENDRAFESALNAAFSSNKSALIEVNLIP